MSVLMRRFTMGSLVVLSCVSYCSADPWIPPRTVTLNTIRATRTRLAEFYSSHHRVPKSLRELPPWSDNKDSSTNDGWGRELGYAFRSRKDSVVVTLWSLGRDNLIGGDGEDADFIERFEFFEGMKGRLPRGLPVIFDQLGKTMWLTIEENFAIAETLDKEGVSRSIRSSIRESSGEGQEKGNSLISGGQEKGRNKGNR